MELDELKKSWSLFSKELQKGTIANEEQIAELIANYKAKSTKSLRRITDFQRASLALGGLALLLCIVSIIFISQWIEDELWQDKIAVILGFVSLSLLAAMAWDWKTYRWSLQTRIDVMPVAEVSRRMTVFRQWMKYEVIALCIWIVASNTLVYWLMDYDKAPVVVQVSFLAFSLAFDAIAIYFLYKKGIYKHLDSIRKNIEELRDIDTTNK